MKRIVPLFLLLCLLWALAGCGTSKPAAEAEAEAAFGLNVCVGAEPASLDPAFYNSKDAATILYHLGEGLCKWMDDGDGQAVIAGGQAASWETENNATVWTFRLRDGLLWSDGRALTANDFVYGWQRAVDPANQSDYAYLLNVIKNAPAIAEGDMAPEELGVTALDDRTLQVTLTESCPYFDQICALPITFPVRRDVTIIHEDWANSAETYVSNGPYLLSEWAHDSYLLATRNPNYYATALTGPESIRFALMGNSKKVYAAYSGDELDFMKTPPKEELPLLQESGELQYAPQLGVYYVTFNTDQDPFDDVRVRQAFSLVINRSYIVSSLCGLGETVAGGFVPDGVYDAAGAAGADFRSVGGHFYTTDYRDYAESCAQARELLASAGYPDGLNFPEVEFVYNTGDRHQAVADALRDMWSIELGVDVQLTPMRWNVLLQVLEAGDFALARGGWVADYNDPLFFLDMWGRDSVNNSAQYSDWEYNSDLRRAKASDDPSVRMNAFHQAEELLIAEDQVVAPIYFYSQPYLLKDTIDDVFTSPLGSFFFTYAKEK